MDKLPKRSKTKYRANDAMSCLQNKKGHSVFSGTVLKEQAKKKGKILFEGPRRSKISANAKKEKELTFSTVNSLTAKREGNEDKRPADHALTTTIKGGSQPR